MLSNDIDAFRARWSDRIARDALAKRVIAELWRTRAACVSPVLDEARAENPIIDPVIRAEPAEMRRHVDDHFRALLTLPSAGRRGRASAPLAFVVAHGVRRAQAGVPLRAVLQAYRSGHKSFWAIMCRTIDRLAPASEAGMRTTMLLSDYCIEYTDLISVVVTDAYVAEEARLAGERTRLSIAVVETLLRGERPGEGPAQELAAAHGIEDGRCLAVLVGRGDGAARQRAELALALQRAIEAAGLSTLVEQRPDEVVAVASGVTPVGTQLAAVLRGARLPGRIGIGLDTESIAGLPQAYAEAGTAFDLHGAERAVAHLAEVDVNAYLRHRADATAHRLLPPLPPEVREGTLAQTLDAFATADLNVKACARRLGVHTNTVYHRLNRIARLTGCDPRRFTELARLVTALRMG